MTLNLCCDIRMVGSKVKINNMKSCIHLALYQWFKLLMVQWCAVHFMITVYGHGVYLGFDSNVGSC